MNLESQNWPKAQSSDSQARSSSLSPRLQDSFGRSGMVQMHIDLLGLLSLMSWQARAKLDILSAVLQPRQLRSMKVST